MGRGGRLSVIGGLQFFLSPPLAHAKKFWPPLSRHAKNFGPPPPVALEKYPGPPIGVKDLNLSLLKYSHEPIK